MGKKWELELGSLRSQVSHLVLWKSETRGVKPTKVPYQVSGEKARTNTPSTWSTLADVLKVRHVDKTYAGQGFVFQKARPYVGIDLDDCITDGKIDQWAEDIISELNSYAEISPSGKGVKTIAKLDDL